MTTTHDGVRQAQLAAGQFEQRYRTDGINTYIALRDPDGAPEWLTTAIHDAHEGKLPDHRVHRLAHGACRALARCGYASVEEARDNGVDHEFADEQVETLNTLAIAWLDESPFNVAYCDEAIEEYGAADSIIKGIQQGQYLQAHRVFNILADAIERSAE